MTKIVKIELPPRGSAYEIAIAPGQLDRAGEWAASALGRSAGRAVIISNRTVHGLYGKSVETGLIRAGFGVDTFLMKDGERYKSLRTLEQALKAMSSSGLARTDAVVALGGGVVGDLAGFAAAVYLRGISFLQIPTTLLSMIDSSVGGKTGVNSAFGKNLIGAFHQPAGVLIDPGVLSTLPRRELTAGLCEMVKHAAVSGSTLLKQTEKFLSGSDAAANFARQGNENFRSEISDLIAANVEFKAKIVAGDERESAGRLDGRSRKILNFGHTFAHALEKVTDYRKFKHGEAVGYGVMFAAELSKSLDLCDEKSVNLLNDVVQRVGTLPPLGNIDPDEVFEAFKFDKKNLAGSLQMVLLKGIGKPAIVNEKDIPRKTVHRVLKELLQKWA